MDYSIFIYILALLPALLIIALRANAAITFMGLCVGSVLVAYTSSDVVSVVDGVANKPHLPVATTQWVQLALLVAPFVLALWFTRRSVKKGSWQVFNILPALGSGLLFCLLAVPLFSSGLRGSLENQDVWHQLVNAQTAVVLLGAALSLTFLLVTHRAFRHSGAKGKKE